jgi:NAD-dependent SIR2 family protein deacetylase
MRFQQFRDEASARQRYWARAFRGWTRFRRAQPNPAHRALAELEKRGYLTGLVTQNVDGLHEAAGSPDPIKLHGELAWVRCLDCDERLPRARVQDELASLNPDFRHELGTLRPDGDVELDEAAVARFRVFACPSCGGRLKPDVVFFGETIPAETKARARALVETSQNLLVVGSSLAVGSAGILARRSARLWILNLGPTRFDKNAHARASAKAGSFLPAVLESLD